MKSLALFAGVLACCLAAAAQSVTDPHITTWLTSRAAQYARIYETSSDKSSGNAVSTWPRSGLTNSGGGQATNAYADVQRVAYSASYVYIYTTGLASYTMGNWLSPTGNVFMFWPTNRAAIHRIPRNPSIPTTKQKANGVGGVWVNGVYLWENGDAQSYTTSTGTVSFNGQGIWNRLAGAAEAFNFDPANGHQPSSGAYHTHINPIGLRYQLGDNVTYNSATKTYSEAGSPTKHSPILGWALDGLPVYGPYGYSSPLDATSGIRRMTSGFQKRDGTNGSTNLTTTGRTTLPVWAASVQGVSTALPSTEYGPNVNSTYPLGTFAEDYDYLGDLGKTQGVDFDLNRQNVRYCVTPEYPNGTYAYFVSIDASGATAFPDVINQEFFGATSGGQGTVTTINESVTDYELAGPAAALTVTAVASSSGVALSWNSAEGATYKVESSSDDTTWTSVATAVTSAGLTTSYTAAASAPYFRVTLTAIATYDSGGTYGTPVGKTGTVQYGASAVAPTITTQPTNATVVAGAVASFAVAATGTAPLSYQWQKGGVAITGATSATYSIAAAQASDAGTYTCLVSNSSGSVTSSGATLAITTAAIAPTVTSQPATATAVAGGSVSFAVTATGTAPLTYQWRKSTTSIFGATNATFTINPVQAGDAGSYSCVVTNSAGSATSTAATLTVTTSATAPTITQEPGSVSATAGSSVSFGIGASGTAPLTFQWFKAGAAITGATAATFVLPSVQSGDAGSYTCTVSNSAGSATSAAATLTVTAAAVAPTIVTSPQPASVTADASATFTVAATGTAPLAYQWYKDGVALAGATSTSLSISGAQSSDAGNYLCQVSNAAGTATSASAALVVNTAATGGGSTGPLPARLVNVSVRAQVGGAAGSPIIGFVLSGTGAGKQVLVRAVGPTLGTFGVANVLADPQLQLWSNNAMIASNDNWRSADAAAFAAVGAFALAAGSADAAIVTNLRAGTFTTPVLAGGGTNGVVLVECYDGSSSDTSLKFINASARASVGTGDAVLIPAFVVQGEGSVRLLIRVVGPTLIGYGLTDALLNPQLTVYRGDTAVAANDNWSDNANANEIASLAKGAGAFALPSGSNDAATTVTATAGAYSVVASGVSGSTGTALVELYVVQ